MAELTGSYDPIIVAQWDQPPAVLGTRYVGLTRGQQHYDQPYTIVREASFEEYIAFCAPNIGTPTVRQRQEMEARCLFYEVSTD